MCSSTLGPASEPSLVTWPTSSSTVLVRLAKRVSAAADSRTCETPPGADDRSSRCMVWMESMISTSGFSRSAVARIVSTLVSASILRPWVGSCRRWARIATCDSDSSPVTYSERLCWASLQAVCSSSVDLPAPGWPPSSTAEPGTSPPPSTRSNSPKVEEKRGTSASETLERSVTLSLSVPA